MNFPGMVYKQQEKGEGGKGREEVGKGGRK